MAAIEDVDYLTEHSLTDTYMLYVDSDKRDRTVWPNPSEFSIQFAVPFRFVYGYDILDGSIPNTTWNVEGTNNRLVLGTVAASDMMWGLSSPNLDAFVAKYQRCAPELVLRMRDANPGALALASRDSMDMYGLAWTATADDIHTHALLLKWEAVGLPAPPEQVEDPSSEEPPVVYEEIVDPETGRTWHIPQQDRGDTDRMSFQPHPDGVLITFFAMCHTSEAAHAMLLQTSSYEVLVTVMRVELAVQHYDNNQLQQNLNNMLNALSMACAHTSSIPEQANRFTFSGSQPFFLNMQASTCRTVLGFDELAVRTGVPGCYTGAPPFIDPDNRMFFSFYNSNTARQELVTPGLLNLAGTRFIVLRCPELETHAFAGRKFDNQASGLGVFKLTAGANGISNLRFDYVNFVRKPFHPIGKLTKLTLRFEHTDGRLYDFKGINCHIMMTLKFFVPSIRTELHRYQINALNDQYDPDMQRYMHKQRALAPEQDKDDAEALEEERSRPTLPSMALATIRGLLSLYDTPAKKQQDSKSRQAP